MDPLALDRQVCFALAAASRSVIGLYRPVLAPLGLTHPQYLVMLSLWERSPRRVGDIAAALYLEPATLSPLLKRLEQAGYLTRSRTAKDERALDVALTPTARHCASVRSPCPAPSSSVSAFPWHNWNVCATSSPPSSRLHVNLIQPDHKRQQKVRGDHDERERGQMDPRRAEAGIRLPECSIASDEQVRGRADDREQR